MPETERRAQMKITKNETKKENIKKIDFSKMKISREID